MSMYPHNWVKSQLGHGENQCTYCLATNREIAVVGDMNHCEHHPLLRAKEHSNPQLIAPLREVVQQQLTQIVVRQLKTGKFVDMPSELFANLLDMAMSNPIYMVEEFHRRFNLHVHEECIVPTNGTYGDICEAKKFRNGMTYEDLAELRLKLLDEEFNTEYCQADIDLNPTEMVDALCDIIYVAVGAALEFGLPIRRGLEEVHSSNMSKLDENGKPIYREDGKILKGPNYSPPNWVKVFQQWEEERGRV